MIKHVDSNDVDFEKIAHLQQLHADNLFCYSAYFEPLFERWCALVLNDYEGVLLVPYQKFGPWKWSFTPLFYRATPWLGAWSEDDKNEALAQLAALFHFGELNLEFTQSLSNTLNYQIFPFESNSNSQYNTLTNRMIRKAKNLDLQLTNELDIDHFSQFLYEELNAKVEGINKDSMLLFKRLIKRLYESRKLIFEGVVIGGVLVGGILIVQGQGRHLYLKGTATREAKKLGVYYWLMHRAIERAREQHATFDFGGSGIEGVAQFNRNFGAVDAFYSRYTWGKIPLLFKILKRLKRAWKKMNV